MFGDRHQGTQEPGNVVT